jgi:regulator of cell morphogenesis and NO signaling
MQVSKESIIGDIVTANYKYAQVFKNVGIDFCCNGNRTIEQACEKKGIEATDILQQLQKLDVVNNSITDYNSWPLDLLADYVVKKHHRYVEQKTLEIKPYLNKIVKVHGAQHPELAEVEALFNASAGELAQHMKKEELVLFPYVAKLVQAQQNHTKTTAHFGTVQNPIQMMMAEHDTEGERFRKIAELTNNYTPPADACNTYIVTFGLLKEFEDDLHMHIHLENNILFPKAIELEKQMNA